MDNTLLTLIPTAIGIAISPVPLMELILVLFSKRRTTNTLAFVGTLLASTAVLLFIGAQGGQAIAGDDASGPSTGAGVLFAVLGALLLAVGVKNWRNRADTSEPKVLSTISGMGPLPVAFLAFGTVFVNPKNTVLLLTAGQAIGRSEASLGTAAVFVLVATAPYLLAAGYSLFGGAAAQQRLDAFRVWLVGRNRAIMGVLCFALGALLVLKGVAAIAG